MKTKRSPAPLWGAATCITVRIASFVHKGRGLLLLVMTTASFAQMTLTGRVLLPDSSAVAFANVTLLGEKQQTTTSGRFSYEISEAVQKKLGVEIGDDLPILVEKEGLVLLQPANGRVRIPRKAMSQELEIIMARKGSPLLIKSEAVLENLIQQRVSAAILAEKSGGESLRDVLAEEALRLGFDKDQLREAMNHYKESLRKSEDAIKRGLAALEDANEEREAVAKQQKLREAKENFRDAIRKDEAAARVGHEATTRLPESYFNLGLIYFNDAIYDSAVILFSNAVILDSNYTQALDMWGETLYYLADYSKALEKFQRAYCIDSTRNNLGVYRSAIRLNNIASVMAALGDYSGALKKYDDAMELSEKSFGRFHPTIATTLNNIGEIFRTRGDIDGALQKYYEALKIDTVYLGKNHQDVAADLNNIALALNAKGEYTTALTRLNEALRIWRETLGEAHPYVATVLNNVGEVFRAKGDYNNALEYYDQALSIYIQSLGRDHPNTKIVSKNREQTWWTTLSESERWRVRIQLRESRLKGDLLSNMEKLQLLNETGIGYSKLNLPDSALIYLQQALPLAQQLNEQETLGNLYNNLGAAYKLQQDWPQALHWLEKSVSHNLRMQGDSASVLAYTYFHLAGVADAQGQSARAREYAQKSLALAERHKLAELRNEVEALLKQH